MKEKFSMLKREIEYIAFDTVNMINSINAFGNKTVKLNLAESASDIISILNDQINHLQDRMLHYLELAVQRYKSIGSNAEIAAKISSN